MLQNTGQNLREIGDLTIEALATYLEESKKGLGKVLQLDPIETISNQLQIKEYIRNGGIDHNGFKSFLETYLKYSMHLHHPAYIGHQVAPPHFCSGISDFIHGVIANPMSIFEMGPSAATIEYEMVQWMLQKVGWQNEGAGLFTHGGSVANIHAMLAARADIAPDAWQKGNPGDLVVLAPASSHYSIARSVSILGLGSNAIIPIPTDQYERVIPDLLEEKIIETRRNGKRIMAVIADACATATGIYDPIEEMGLCCQEHNCWLHLDSPHGATAILSEKYAGLMKGIELADSLNWDAHKMMQTSTLSTAILFRNKKHLAQTFTQTASYLIHPKESMGIDTLPFQIECTKAGIATKLFLVLAAIGEKGMGEFITTLYDRSKEFAEIISAKEGFTVGAPVESNIICFQYRSGKYDQLKLKEKLIGKGDFYITSTELGGARYLRLVVMNEQTHKNTIHALLENIVCVAEEL